MHELIVSFKKIWGAADVPFSAAPLRCYESPAYKKGLEQLRQFIAIKASGIIWGPNGVGKSRLVQSLVAQLPEQAYWSLVLTHSSLKNSDFLRYLCIRQGLTPRGRRSDNVIALRKRWTDLNPVWPVILLEEAQNMTPDGLEEVRLLLCDTNNSKPPFSLILVGDENLLAQMRLGVHRPLLTRLSFSLELTPWPEDDCLAYINHRLAEVNIHRDIFSPQAKELILRAANGIPRIINNLAQGACLAAANAGADNIDVHHVQASLQQQPW